MKSVTAIALVAVISVMGACAAEPAKPAAAGNKPSAMSDNAAPPACVGKDSQSVPCAATAAPADDVDHAAHHP